MTKAKRPPIHMIDSEADALADMAYSAKDRLPQASELLVTEIERAKIYSVDRIPADVVTMGSTVEYVDEASGAIRTVQLVYPGDADLDAGRLSIMTPMGAGLIGLREGQTIAWPDRDGQERDLRIVKVRQAERTRPE